MVVNILLNFGPVINDKSKISGLSFVEWKVLAMFAIVAKENRQKKIG